MSKLEKLVTTVQLEIPFQKKEFITYTIFSIIGFVASLVLTMMFPAIGNFPVIIITIYFIPSMFSFDIIGMYKEEYKIPKLLHPNRFFITALNIALGWTVIGWIICLKMALTPGKVEVIRVEYI